MLYTQFEPHPLTSSRPKGAAMIIAMAIIILLAGLSAALLSEMHTRSLHVQVDLEDIKAFEAAEAGIDVAINDINQSALTTIPGVTTPTSGKPVYVHDPVNKPGCIGTKNWVKATDDTLPAIASRPSGTAYIGRPTWMSIEATDTGGNLVFHEPHITPQQIGDVAFFTYAVNWLNDGIDNNGDGSVDDVTERNKFTIFSTGIHRGAVKSGITQEGKIVTVEVIVEAKDADAPPLPSSPIELQIK